MSEGQNLPSLALVLHAHLPFVRHPEHAVFLEENWLFEAVAEVYLPLLEVLESWENDGVDARICLTLTPTLCAMLADGLLQERCGRYLESLAELAEKEIFRTMLLPEYQTLAQFYRLRFLKLRALYGTGAQLLNRFRKLQDEGRLEILTCSATHAVLPLLGDVASVRAQLQIGVDSYRAWFGRSPRGIWLPECAYEPGLDFALKRAGLQWFITDTHGLLHATPKPQAATFAPIITPAGLAAFGRDHASARQVWSRNEGYPGDPRYREFYRDLGFDADADYVRPHLAVPDQRGFTGLKYHRVTSPGNNKLLYDRPAAMQAVLTHAAHFLEARARQLQRAAGLLRSQPMAVAPYDAELFGHWWFEGPEFINHFVRLATQHPRRLVLRSPSDFLDRRPTHQCAEPAASSWGEGGYWKMWLSGENQWIYRHLRTAQATMTCLTDQYSRPGASPAVLQERMLRQAGRELLLAQASDWPFILRTGTSPDYARRRIEQHLANFNWLADQLRSGRIDESALAALEQRNNLFPSLDWRYWVTDVR